MLNLSRPPVAIACACAIAVVVPLLPVRLSSSAAPPGAADPAPLEIRLVEVPPVPVVLRDVTGSYEQHGQVIGQLFTTLGMAGIPPRGNVLGVYFDDPKLVDADALRWQVAVPVAREVEVTAPLRFVTLPGILAAEYRTTVANLEHVDEPVRAWMQENGCTRSGPVRMEYLDQNPDPEAMRVRVLVPVSRQEADASDAAAGTLAALAFITGTWRAEQGEDRLVEQWGPPVGDSMVGTFQWIRPAGVWMYELMSIQQRGDEVLFQLRHFDRDFTAWEERDNPVRARLVESSRGRAVFENVKRDADPYRFVFEAAGAAELRIRLLPREGDEVNEFRFRRATPAAGR